MAQHPSTRAREGNTCWVEADIEDQGVAIPNTSIDTAVMSLKNDSTGKVINSRTAVDVISYIDGAGHFEFLLEAADNAIQVTTGVRQETHVMTLVISATVSGDTIVLKDEIHIIVENLKHTT